MIYCILISAVCANYVIHDVYTGHDLFHGIGWNFFNQPDPTNGAVSYRDRDSALQHGLIDLDGDAVILGAKRVGAAPSTPYSVRLESEKLYDGGLFIWDVLQMPDGCGSWPAIWSYGDNWPYRGEIDVLEGVNGYGNNQMTLHTGPGCTMPTAATPGNCNAGNAFLGCHIKAFKANDYGHGFNSVGGGVFVMEWNESHIKIWQFLRKEVPEDVLVGNPNPETWGEPQAYFPFGTHCDKSNFKQHKLTVNLTFCGDWAGAVFSGQCGHTQQSCQQYVESGDFDFSKASFKINSIKVYNKE